MSLLFLLETSIIIFFDLWNCKTAFQKGEREKSIIIHFRKIGFLNARSNLKKIKNIYKNICIYSIKKHIKFIEPIIVSNKKFFPKIQFRIAQNPVQSIYFFNPWLVVCDLSCKNSTHTCTTPNINQFYYFIFTLYLPCLLLRLCS